MTQNGDAGSVIRRKTRLRKQCAVLSLMCVRSMEFEDTPPENTTGKSPNVSISALHIASDAAMTYAMHVAAISSFGAPFFISSRHLFSTPESEQFAPFIEARTRSFSV